MLDQRPLLDIRQLARVTCPLANCRIVLFSNRRESPPWRTSKSHLRIQGYINGRDDVFKSPSMAWPNLCQVELCLEPGTPS